MPNQSGQFDDLTIDVAGHRGIVEFVEPRVGAIVCLKHLAQIGEVFKKDDNLPYFLAARGVVDPYLARRRTRSIGQYPSVRRARSPSSCLVLTMKIPTRTANRRR